MLLVNVALCHLWASDSLKGFFELSGFVCVSDIVVWAEVAAAGLGHDWKN